MELDFLIVDDDQDALFINEYIINQTKLGGKIYTAESASDAFSLLENLEREHKKLPNVILLDIRMPIMDGFAFLRKLNEIPGIRQENCKVVMVTSSLDAEDYKRAMENPFVIDYVPKPLTSEKISHIAEKLPVN
jgi:CheY-like chemotaxis protein